MIFWIVVDLLRPRAALEAEILVFRQQVIVLRRGRPSRLSFLTIDKIVLGWVCYLVPLGRRLAYKQNTSYLRMHPREDVNGEYTPGSAWTVLYGKCWRL